MAGKKNKAGAKGKKKGGGLKIILIMIVVGALIPFGMPTLLVATGLIPTLVALVTDTDEHKSSAATIGFLNIAGVFPFLMDLWSRGQTMDVAFSIVRKPENWLIMLGSAAIGKLLLYAIPPVIAMMTVSQIEGRIKKLKEAQEELKKVWGPDVANISILEEVRRRNLTEN